MAGEGGGAGAVAPGQVVGGGVAVAGGGGARCQRVGSTARCKVATCRCFPCERVRGRAPPSLYRTIPPASLSVLFYHRRLTEFSCKMETESFSITLSAFLGSSLPSGKVS